jgi:hypothetical protein
LRSGDVVTAGLLAALDPLIVFERNGITPDPEQARVLRAWPCMCLVCWSRQSGKSTTFGGLAEFVSNNHPGALTLICSKNHDKAKELLAKTAALHEPFEEENPLVYQSTERLVYRNEAEVRAVPSTLISGRGPTAKLILNDEAAWTPRALIENIFPTLMRTNGTLVAMSTPPERPEGWWWEAWTNKGELSGREALALNGRDMWFRSYIDYVEAGHASEDHIENAKRLMTDEAFQREYLCRFPDPKRDGARLPVSAEDLAAVFAPASGDPEMPRARE